MFFVYLSTTESLQKKNTSFAAELSFRNVQGGLWEKIKLPIYAGLWYFFNVSRLSLDRWSWCRERRETQKHGVSDRTGSELGSKVIGSMGYNTNFFPWDIQVNDLDVVIVNDVVGHFGNQMVSMLDDDPKALKLQKQWRSTGLV